QNAWGPADFGQARMAAFGWMLSLAQKAGKTADDVMKEYKPAEGKGPQDVRKLWDWYYLNVVQQEGRGVYESAKLLAKAEPNDPSALWVYLTSLSGRAAQGGRQVYYNSNNSAVDKTPPLPNEELDHVVALFKTLRRVKPDWTDSGTLINVMTELKRA